MVLEMWRGVVGCRGEYKKEVGKHTEVGIFVLPADKNSSVLLSVSWCAAAT